MGARSISSYRRPLFLPGEQSSDNDGPSYSMVVRQLRPVKQSSGSAMATVGSGKRSDGVFYSSLLQGCLVSEEGDVGGRQIR
nr:hypothetical protein Itr_chr13CG10450 [Ipomoea trifida]